MVLKALCVHYSLNVKHRQPLRVSLINNVFIVRLNFYNRFYCLINFHKIKNWTGVVALGIVEVAGIPIVLSYMDSVLAQILTVAITAGVLALMAYIVKITQSDHESNILLKKISSNIATINESIKREKEERDEMKKIKNYVAQDAHEVSIKLLEEQKTKLEGQLQDIVDD